MHNWNRNISITSKFLIHFMSNLICNIYFNLHLIVHLMHALCLLHCHLSFLPNIVRYFHCLLTLWTIYYTIAFTFSGISSQSTLATEYILAWTKLRIAVDILSKMYTGFYFSCTAIIGSIPFQGMDYVWGFLCLCYEYYTATEMYFLKTIFLERKSHQNMYSWK